MRRPSYPITPGDPYVMCPVRSRRLPIDVCLDCPWFEDVDVGYGRRSWLLCEPPGYWPLRLEVAFATRDEETSGPTQPAQAQ